MWGLQSIDEVITRLKRTDRLIVDPFSVHTDPKHMHATSGYALAIFDQVRTHDASALPVVKENVLECIHPDYRHNFYEKLEDATMFVNGATHEVISRAAYEAAPIDDRLTLLHNFTKFRGRILRLGQALGPDFILKKLPMAVPNLTSAIMLQRLSPVEYRIETAGRMQIRPDDTKYFFSYISTKQYVQHILYYFGDEYEAVEERNFEFTKTMMLLLPVMFGTVGIRGEQITQPDKRMGKLIHSHRTGMSYYFAIEYPEVVPWFERLRAVVQNRGGQFEVPKQAKHIFARIIAEEKSAWDEEQQRLGKRMQSYSKVQVLTSKLVRLSMERLKDISEIGPHVNQLVTGHITDLDRELAEVSRSRMSEIRLELTLDFQNPEDILNLSSAVGRAYADAALIEHKIALLNDKLSACERRAVESIVDGYKHARDQEGFVLRLFNLLNRKDTFVDGHQNRVHDIVRHWARAMGISDADIIAQMALYHDFGKLAIPREILLNAGKLDDIEYGFIRKHPSHGAQILAGMGLDQRIVEAARYHHEQFDGGRRSYPGEVRGREIPEGARIVTIIDVVDAIAGERPYDSNVRGYRRTWKDAVQAINECKGTQFDPELVDEFNELLVESGFIRDFYETFTQNLLHQEPGLN